MVTPDFKGERSEAEAGSGGGAAPESSIGALGQVDSSLLVILFERDCL